MTSDKSHFDMATRTWGPRAHARNSDPDTSLEAADSMTPHKLGDLEGKIYALLMDDLRRGGVGLTVPEIADALGLPRDTASPRMKTLVKRGLVEKTKATKVPSGHSRSCIIWKAIP